LLTCHRYIELNPVRAGLVPHPLEYPWSSHAHYAVAARNPLITRHALLNELAGDVMLLAGFQAEISPNVLARIRTAVNRGWALGTDDFLDRVEGVLGRSIRPPKRGRPFKDKVLEARNSKMSI
jgi:putative transposase